MNDFESSLSQVLLRLNVPCKDDRRRFTVTDRPDAIRDLLSGSQYHLLHDGDLSMVYGREEMALEDGFFLVSCHIDSVYGAYFHKGFAEEEMLGTFDNSICNALLTNLMLQGRLPSEALVAFTGDEEDTSHGADDVLTFLSRSGLGNPELVIVLDITSEAYGSHSYTIENVLLGDQSPENSRLGFSGREQLADYLQQRLHASNCHVVLDADPDESERYNECGFTCFTFCMPTSPHHDNVGLGTGHWMHSEKGVRVRKLDITGFADALALLCRGISEDLRRQSLA